MSNRTLEFNLFPLNSLVGVCEEAQIKLSAVSVFLS
jgi:hypothetical protein